MALVRRYLIRLRRLDNRPEDLLILSGLLVVLVVGFVLEGIRMAALPDDWENWSPVGWATSASYSQGCLRSLWKPPTRCFGGSTC